MLGHPTLFGKMLGEMFDRFETGQKCLQLLDGVVGSFGRVAQHLLASRKRCKEFINVNSAGRQV